MEANYVIALLFKWWFILSAVAWGFSGKLLPSFKSWGIASAVFWGVIVISDFVMSYMTYRLTGQWPTHWY